ncbi:uncharacterized protein LOC133369752 [Rhineura floridana]|uniref:uncharacterized protein LOC133369752 n=1 Tax=Rhineura floridana TaxID=261503 RepID=UPI002AC82D1A|nr:uncharacterized protein LOC133369752 [Rhineura floridana]
MGWPPSEGSLGGIQPARPKKPSQQPSPAGGGGGESPFGQAGGPALGSGTHGDYCQAGEAGTEHRGTGGVGSCAPWDPGSAAPAAFGGQIAGLGGWLRPQRPVLLREASRMPPSEARKQDAKAEQRSPLFVDCLMHILTCNRLPALQVFSVLCHGFADCPLDGSQGYASVKWKPRRRLLCSTQHALAAALNSKPKTTCLYSLYVCGRVKTGNHK